MRGSVTDSQPPEDREPEAQPNKARRDDNRQDDPAPFDVPDGDALDEDVFDDVGDLDDLDALGIDGVVAQMTGEPEDLPIKRRRPPWVSAIVILACLYPLVSMWDDFRYWLRSGEPESLGDVAALLDGGGIPADLANRYVSIEGTPDVQWATVLTKRSGAKVSYLRVIEGGGSLFAAVPKPKGDAGKTAEYPSHFTGRVSRLGDAGAFSWIRQLFIQEGVMQLEDTSAEALAAALRTADGDALRMQVEGGVVVADPADSIRFVAKPNDARVLLGVESFPDAEKAEAAIAALGYPYLSLGKGRTDLLRYIVRMPESARDQARRSLLAEIEGEVDETDPKEGVSIFGLSATYVAGADVVELDGDAITFPYGDNTTTPGYAVEDGKLVPAKLEGGRVRIPLAELSAVRVEKPIAVDPNGYLIEAGVPPSSQLRWALAWLVVLGLALTNAGVLFVTLRRSKA